MSENLIIVPIVRDINVEPIPTFGKKVGREIIVTLFNDCNLNCSFCNGCLVVPEEYDQSLMYQMANDVCRIFDVVSDTTIKVKFTGGEILQDKFKDEQFEHYAKICSIIRDYASSIGKVANLSITSNLIFKKRERVLKFLVDNDIAITGSFDMVGRFDNPKLVDLFIENVDYLTNNGKEVKINFVAHKGNINAIVNREQYIEQFEYLYNNYKVMLDHYTPVGVKEYDVSEQELSEFLKFLYHNYPNIEHLKAYVNNFETKKCEYIDCNRSVWVNGNGIVGDCNGNFVNGFVCQLEEKNCVMCKHLSYCKLVCSRIYRGTDFCYLRDFYDYLESLECKN